MHRCWQIPELVHRIVEEVHPGYRNLDQNYFVRRADEATVATLARTAHLFLEPALDVLWYTQLDLQPSLKLLGSCGCDEGEPLYRHFTLDSAAAFREWVRAAHVYDKLTIELAD